MKRSATALLLLGAALMVATVAAQDNACKGSSCGKSYFPFPGACVADGFKLDPKAKGCCADDEFLTFLRRIIDVMGNDAYAAVKTGSDKGNPPFGGAILKNEPKNNWPTIITSHNTVFEDHNPTLHGEVNSINQYFKVPSDKRYPVEQTYFIATHQPCTICMSSLAFGGFRRIIYGFGWDDAVNDGKTGGILDPHIVESTFGLTCGKFNYTNGLNTYAPLGAMLDISPCGNAKVAAALAKEKERWAGVVAKYKALGGKFQQRLAEANADPNFSGLEVTAENCKDCRSWPRAECKQHGAHHHHH